MLLIGFLLTVARAEAYNDPHLNHKNKREEAYGR